MLKNDPDPKDVPLFIEQAINQYNKENNIG
jgi:hypothetical protein